MKPDFLVIGAMKCATSTICRFFESHPDTYMVARMDPEFFSHDHKFAKGFDAYESLFAPGVDAVLRGEGSNAYANHARFPRAAERIADYRPGMKIIYMVRHPLARVRSEWIQRASDGGMVPATLDQAVMDEPEIYLDQSLYWKNLAEYRARFPDSQIFVGFVEDLHADPVAFYTDLCAFLGISTHVAVERAHVNRSTGKKVPARNLIRLRRSFVAKAAKAVAPAGVKAALKSRFFMRDASSVEDLSPAAKARVLEILRADAAPLLAHAGKPPGFWPGLSDA